MFIFRLFFSLIGMVFALLLLPFRLIKLPIAVILMPLKILLRLIVRNLFLVVLLVIAVFLIFTLSRSKTSMPELTPAATSTAQPQTPVLIQPVTKHEDGDSDFATDLYALMTDQERVQYSQNFYWAMSNLEDGKVHTWNSNNIAGSLRANDTFESNSGERCRHFNEVLKVHQIQQNISGMACDQGNATWCKLKPNATAACGLSEPAGIFGGISAAFRNLF